MFCIYSERLPGLGIILKNNWMCFFIRSLTIAHLARPGAGLGSQTVKDEPLQSLNPFVTTAGDAFVVVRTRKRG